MSLSRPFVGPSGCIFVLFIYVTRFKTNLESWFLVTPEFWFRPKIPRPCTIINTKKIPFL